MKESTIVSLVGAALVVLVLGVCFGLKWYTAGVQSAVYKRQGIHMTTWECFCGAKPAERTFKAIEEKP